MLPFSEAHPGHFMKNRNYPRAISCLSPCGFSFSIALIYHLLYYLCMAGFFLCFSFLLRCHLTKARCHSLYKIVTAWLCAAPCSPRAPGPPCHRPCVIAFYGCHLSPPTRLSHLRARALSFWLPSVSPAPTTVPGRGACTIDHCRMKSLVHNQPL